MLQPSSYEYVLGGGQYPNRCCFAIFSTVAQRLVINKKRARLVVPNRV